MYQLGSKYQLNLTWKRVDYDSNGVLARLEGCIFSGPALGLANRINNNDYIDIDLTSHSSLLFPKSWLVLRLEWGEVIYRPEDGVLLKNAVLRHNRPGFVGKLRDADYIVIDTAKHEEATHHMYPLYEGLVIDENHNVRSIH